MSDLISRQAAIEIIQSMYPGIPRIPWMRKEWQERYEPYIRTEKAIRELPSAQPEETPVLRKKDGGKEMTLRDVFEHAAAAYSLTREIEKLNELGECASIWEDLLDAPLEDLQLSRVDTDDTGYMDPKLLLSSAYGESVSF